jgi:hypothetical protein
MKKVVKNNGWLIAGAGDATPCDLFQYVFVPPIPTVKERSDLYRFMINKFVPAMQECLEENNWKVDPNDKESGFDMIFAFDGEVFQISHYYSVLLNEKGIYGVGSGAQFAIGALEAGSSVEKALEIAADNDVYTSGPFQILRQQKTNKTTK